MERHYENRIGTNEHDRRYCGEPEKSLAYCDEAAGCDLLFFPEIQLSPFFPQYEKKNVDAYAMGEDAEALRLLAQKAGEHHYYLSPNVYLERNGHRYDASL